MDKLTQAEADSMRKQFPTPPDIQWYENIKLPVSWQLVKGNLKGKKVLDIGCASGWVAYWANKNGAKALATDIFETFVHPSIPFQIADKEELPFENESFDVVLTANVLHHGDLAKTLSETHRVLKPGGKFVSLQEPCIENGISERIYLRDNLKKELEMYIKEHRPNIKKYSEALSIFSGFWFYQMNDAMFSAPTSDRLVPITGGDYSGGIAILATK